MAVQNRAGARPQHPPRDIGRGRRRPGRLAAFRADQWKSRILSSRQVSVPGVGFVGGAVVGEHAFDADAAVGEPGHCSTQHAGCGGGGLIVVDLGVGADTP